MIQKYDVAIVGAASAGSYFARRMAERGFKVLLLERHSYERVGTKYDIFHIPTEHFEEFGLPKPREEDPDFGFTFTVSNPTPNSPASWPAPRLPWSCSPTGSSASAAVPLWMPPRPSGPFMRTPRSTSYPS